MEFQNFKTAIYEILFHFGTKTVLTPLCIAIAILCFLKISEGPIDKLKSVLLVMATSFSCYFGARILHVIIERPQLLQTPELIFSRFDGMTFNGSLLFGLLTFWLGLKMFHPRLRPRYWDLVALLGAFSYGTLRIGCFSSGCCWGKVSAVPWSVKYSHSLFMPWLGIPVHPVQLYDSLVGFLVLGILLTLKSHRKVKEGQLLVSFLFFYSIGRFITEFFRGDSFRGEEIFLNMSTSQLVSVAIIFFLSILFFYKKWRVPAVRPLAMMSFFFLSGCLPQAPQDKEFKSVQKNEFFEIYETSKPKDLPRKNVLFVAGDEHIQFEFTRVLKSAFHTKIAPRLEDIVFWDYIKNLNRTYNIILRIKPQGVGFTSFSSGLKYMEDLGQPYDLILLTHGLPNYLSTGSGYFFSYEDLKNLKGKLSNLNLVMMQSCYGESLAQDFKDAGAKSVLGYPKLNQNFFFYGVFLKYYGPKTNASLAYFRAKKNFYSQIVQFKYAPILKLLMSDQNRLLISQGQSPINKDQFIQSLPFPVLE